MDMNSGIASVAPPTAQQMPQAPEGVQAAVPQAAPAQAPQMPQMPQQAGGASIGIASDVSNLSDEELIQGLAGMRPEGPAICLAEINKRNQERKQQKAVQGQQAIQQNQQMQQEPPLRDQVIGEYAELNSGIGTQPYGFASGGIVGFQTAGSVEDPYPANGQELQRLGSQFGIVLSPYDSPDVRVKKIQQIKQIVAASRQIQENRAEIPTPDSEANRLALQAAFADPSRRRDIQPPMGVPNQQMQQRPPQRPPQQSSAMPNAGIRSNQGPAPMQEDPELQAARQAYLNSMQRQSESPEVAAAREALKKSTEGVMAGQDQNINQLMEDLRRRMGEANKPAPGLFQDRIALARMLNQTRGANTLGDALAGAAGAYADYSEDRRKESETREAGFRKEKIEIAALQQARKEYERALRQQEYTEVKGTEAEKRQAAQELAKAKYDLLAKERDFQLKKFGEQSEAGLRTAQAGALLNRPAGTGGPKPMSEGERARLELQARTQVKKDLGTRYAAHLLEQRKANKPPMSMQAFEDMFVRQIVDSALSSQSQSGGAAPGGGPIIDFRTITGAK